MFGARNLISVKFYSEPSGREPVRLWLETLDPKEQARIEDDIRIVKFRWPLGFPHTKPLGNGLWEIRTRLKNRITRVIFCFVDNQIILLHAFIKKTQKTPRNELEIAKRRAKNVGGFKK